MFGNFKNTTCSKTNRARLYRVSQNLYNIFYFTYISAWENDKILYFFLKMHREKLYKNCMNKSLLQNKKIVSKFLLCSTLQHHFNLCSSLLLHLHINVSCSLQYLRTLNKHTNCFFVIIKILHKLIINKNKLQLFL